MTVKQTLVAMVINTGDAVIAQGPLVVQRWISANRGLNFNPGFFLCFFFKSISSDNLFYDEKKYKTEFAFPAFIIEFKFCTYPGLS